MKLYWRVKRNGKWTWRPLVVDDVFTKKILDRLAAQSGLGEEE